MDTIFDFELTKEERTRFFDSMSKQEYLSIFDEDSINAHLYRLFSGRKQPKKAAIYRNLIKDAQMRADISYCDIIS